MAELTLRTMLLFNLCYWSAIATLELGSFYLESTAFADHTGWQVYQLMLALCAGQAVLTSGLMASTIGRRLSARRLLYTTLLLGLCYVPLSNLLIRFYYQDFDFPLPALMARLDTQLLAFFVWASAYLIYQHNLAAQQQQRAAAALQQQIQHAELATLQQQLNPHFTFNALNSLCALLEARRFDDAEQMSEQLATFLRYSLAHPPLALVPLAEELAAVQAYLNLQRIRFGPRLRVNWQNQLPPEQLQVPVLLLQPLLENAVKYAVASRREGACITIGLYRQQQQLVLEVADDGPGAPADTATTALNATETAGSRSVNAPSTGVGLQNIRQRLARHFGDAASLTLLTPAQGFAVRIIIPVQP